MIECHSETIDGPCAEGILGELVRWSTCPVCNESCSLNFVGFEGCVSEWC